MTRRGHRARSTSPEWSAPSSSSSVTVLVVNGVNLIDGLDMLAAGVVAVGGRGLRRRCSTAPDGSSAMALAAALVGFLVYNRPPARVYLGDGGSYLLGTALAVLLRRGVGARGGARRSVSAALALVAVPAAEVAFAVVRRARGRLVAAGR